MSKRRGFTLVEVLVVIAIASLAFSLIGGFLIYLTETTGRVIDKSEEIMTTQTIKDSIRGVIEKAENKQETLESLFTGSFSIENDKNENGYFRLENGDFIRYSSGADREIIIEDTGLGWFSIIVEDGFYVCRLHYESGAEYKFIIGVE